MAILPVLRYPDPRLKTRSAPVARFDAGLAALAKNLAETMRAAPGIGTCRILKTDGQVRRHGRRAPIQTLPIGRAPFVL